MSQFMGLVYCSMTTANVAIGYGKHAYTLDLETVRMVGFINSVSFVFGIISFVVPKLAVAALLNRILVPSFWQKTWLWIVTGTGTAISTVAIIVPFTMCNPTRALWDISLVMEGKATCRDVWILIHYAIFTGGEHFPCLILRARTDL
jgi:hypothetical protein